MSHSGKVLDEVHILGPQIKEKQVPQVTLRAQTQASPTGADRFVE